MDERSKILAERRAFWENRIRSVLKKYMPEIEIISITQSWTGYWRAEDKLGNMFVFDSVSYYPSTLGGKITECYFYNTKNRKRIIYWRG